MEGYNPSVSLLPQGSGVIHHMSGGNAPPNSAATEEWTGPGVATTKTITTS